MEKLFVNLEKFSSIFFGVNFLKNTPKTKIQVLATILSILTMFSFIAFAFYNLWFGLNVTFQTKLMLIIIFTGSTAILMVFISYWRKESQYQLLAKWVQERYLSRSFKLIDDFSKIEYQTCSNCIWKISK